MFYPNLINGNLKYKKFDFVPFNNGINSKLDEKLLPLGRCDSMYNFNCSTGALIDGIGISDLKLIWDNFYDIKYKDLGLPQGTYIKSCYFFKYWDTKTNEYLYILLLYGVNKKIYFNIVNTINTEWHEVSNLEFSVNPMVIYAKVNNIDSLIFYTKEDGMFVWNFNISQVYKVENAPLITSMCIHNNRMFATIEGESRSIIFSEELNPINFNVSVDEGGYIEIGEDFGKCNKVVSFNGDLYVFKDYSIARITETKDRNEFSITQIYAGNGKIYPNTVAICGDKILFLATDGIYEFNGSKAKKIEFDFDNKIVGLDNHFSKGYYFNGEYYLACYMEFDDDYLFEIDKYLSLQNNSLIKINVNTYQCEIQRGCDIREFLSINDGVNNSLLVIYAFELNSTSVGILNKSGNIKNQNIMKLWKSKMYDFNVPDKVKFIKEITLISKANVFIDIYLDDRIKTINIKGKESSQIIKINEKAKRVGFQIRTDKCNNYISIPQLKVGFYE